MYKPTGDIHQMSEKDISALREAGAANLFAPLTDEQAQTLEEMPRKQRKNKMRNHPCTCGSGKKYKKCCW